MKRILLCLLALAALLVGGPALAQANVSSAFVDGDLYFYDKSGAEIFHIDGTNRKMLFPSGSALDVDAAAGILLPAAGEIVNADISASAAIARSKLAEDALQAYPVILRTNTFTALAGSEAAGTFNQAVGTNLVTINGEVTDNETEVSVGYFQFMLPAEYVAAGDVVVRFRSALIAAASPTNNGSTLDLECYKQADAAVGSDLVSTAAVTYAALGTYYSEDFTVTATGLVAGDVLTCKVTTSIVDSEAGGGTITWKSDPIKVLLDVKG